MMRSRVRISAAAVALLGLARAPDARADEKLREEVTSVHVWYGPDVALAYGAAYALLVPGVLLSQQDASGWRVFGAVLMGSGGLVSILIPPAIHWHNDNFGGGLASFGGQFGGIVVGGLTGAGIAELAGADDSANAVLLGVALGHVAWALVDVFALAHADRVTERRLFTSLFAPNPSPMQ
jgi:hypothetical protein